jgi:hypothetical protein
MGNEEVPLLVGDVHSDPPKAEMHLTNSVLSVIPEDESAKAMSYELSIYGAGA